MVETIPSYATYSCLKIIYGDDIFSEGKATAFKSLVATTCVMFLEPVMIARD